VSGDNLQDLLIVEVLTDEGITGLGEVHTNPDAARAIIDGSGYHTSSRGLREILVGEDPGEIGRLWDRMYALTQSYGRRGLAVHAISGIDIALWDILGKTLGKPVYQVLGSVRRTSVPAYASDLTPPGHDEAIQTARRHVDAGFRAVKLGWGALGSDIAADIELVRRLREAVGPSIDLMVDLGMPVALDDAIRLGRALADYGVYFLEEPLSPDDLDGWRRLVDQPPTPVACGEKETTRYGFRDLMERGGLRIVQPDVARAGGITECLRIAALAELHRVRVIPHCWSSDILVAATMHLITTLSDCPYLEYNAMEQPLRTQLITEPIRPRDGIVHVPEGPGLGIELNEEVAGRYEIR
jgi:L-alanine-DL-glutamate epimerase-like enolase superfamily enzyme